MLDTTEPLAVSTKEAASLLRVSVATIKNYIAQGKLDSVKLGDGSRRGTRRIIYASIKRLLRQM